MSFLTRNTSGVNMYVNDAKVITISNQKGADDLTDDSGNSKGGFDFISKLLSWLADLFRMFTRWITNV